MYPRKVIRTRTSLRSVAFLLRLSVLICLSSCAAFAQQPQSERRDMEKERAIWEQLRTVSPQSVETFRLATEALDRKDYAEAARLYGEVRQSAPDFGPALRRHGFALIHTGREAAGRALLERAVALERSPENLLSLGLALMQPASKTQPVAVTDKERALALFVEAVAASPDSVAEIHGFVAQLSLELNKEESFRAATKALMSKHTDWMPTHYYEAVRAAWDEDWATAEAEIARARELGLPAEEAQAFLDSGVSTRATVWRFVRYALYLTGVWALGLVLLFALGKFFSTATLRSIETANPDELTNSRQDSLRKCYRALINVAGLYYYVSIPVVIILVVLVAGSIIYAFISAGRIPVKLTALLIIGALVTVAQMLRSLFVKREQDDPGRALGEQEAPGLWALVREVAAGVGTRPVDEIRVTPGTDLAVYERGSLGERRRDAGARVLILGIGVLNDFNQNSFRAVLAHEYGHFTNRDTAGGDVALRVSTDMMNFARAMAEGGQAVWWNVAYLFLRVYHFIFRRISHGATRLQEMLADRVAVHNYGARAFKEGLSHVLYRAVEFEHQIAREINEATNTRRAVQNLYELPPTKGGDGAGEVEAAFNRALNRQTTEDDTHPSPVKRFRLASRVTSKGEPPAAGMVWELFADRAALTREMSEAVNLQIRESPYYACPEAV